LATCLPAAPRPHGDKDDPTDAIFDVVEYRRSVRVLMVLMDSMRGQRGICLVRVKLQRCFASMESPT
jgi:hypothetical protein